MDHEQAANILWELRKFRDTHDLDLVVLPGGFPANGGRAGETTDPRGWTIALVQIALIQYVTEGGKESRISIPLEEPIEVIKAKMLLLG